MRVRGGIGVTCNKPLEATEINSAAEIQATAVKDIHFARELLKYRRAAYEIERESTVSRA